MLHAQMVRTFTHKLGTDWRFRVAFALVGVAIAVSVGLLTGRLGEGGIVLSLFAIVSGLTGYREERSARPLASTGRESSDPN